MFAGSRWAALLGAMVVLFTALGARADRVASVVPGGKPVEVPKELMPWVPWVLDGLSDELCVKLGDKPSCVWPAAVELTVEDRGAQFRLEVTRDTDGWVVLPGSAEHWPLEVKADGKDAVVLERESSPAVSVARGPHAVVGRFRWPTAPETLPVPGGVAVVKLSVRGKPLDFPRREEGGAVWLQAGTGSDGETPERAEVEVTRRLDDGVPIKVTTRLVLRVSGKTRELRFADPLVTGSRAASASSPVPLRFEPSGELVLQVRPGEYTVELVGVLPVPPRKLTVPKRPSPWPAQEIWVWNPATDLRQVVLGGVPAIDPAQTNLPDAWKKLQAFALGPDRSLSFETVRRGQPEPPPNRLTLKRTLWLDLDGGGYTVEDKLSGTMNRDYRLELAAAPLGRAVVGGTDWLITQGPTGPAGIELRKGAVDVRAEWRLVGALRNLQAVGWGTDVANLDTSLHLPPGWELLGVTGADSASDTWLSHWTLWGFFFVLVVAFAVARFAGLGWGTLALAALVLSHDRPDAPVVSWVVLLVLGALLYLVPRGKFRTVLRVAWFGTAVVLAILVTKFAVGEVRSALFPTTVESQEGGSVSLLPYREAQVSKAAAPSSPPAASGEDRKEAAEMAQSLREDSGTRAKSEAGGMGGLKLGGKAKLARQQVAEPAQDPEAVIQTGPGLPNWTWKTISLGWSGPVARDQHVRLWLLSPLLTGFLGCLRAALVALLGYVLVRATPRGAEPPAKRTRHRVAAAATAGIVAALWPSAARAEAPSAELLEELKTRLSRGPDCDPCVDVAVLDFRLEQSKLSAVADVHAGAVTAYQIPGPARSWVPSSVRVDGAPARAMVLGEDGFLHLRLGPGRHRVEIDGPIAGSDLTLTPGTAPRQVGVVAKGWTVDGVRDGRAEGSLHFTRTARAAEAVPDSPRVTLPPWLEITRTFDLGVSWKIQTEVKRISSTGEPLSIRYPLLAGEQVTEPGALVENGVLVVAMERDQDQVSYRSTLQPRPKLELRAPVDRPWTEDWRIRASPIWHPTFRDLAPYQQLDQGAYAPRFRPWPGERLTVELVKLAAAPGGSRTVDAATLELTPGQRLVAASLELTARVSKGGAQVLTLPPGATVQTLTVNGVEEPIRVDGQRLELALRPGEQRVHLTWHEPRGLGVWFRSSSVGAGAELVNAKVRVTLPRDRWLWFVTGPSWGPRVLLWAYVLLLLAAAAVLARLPRNPLRRAEWWLLGLGLTQVPVVVALLIAAWFFTIALRGAWQPRNKWYKHLVQLSLPVFTLVFLGCLAGTVYTGLVENPDMLVSGATKADSLGLAWYVDRAAQTFPVAQVLSVPLWAWRLLNLVWALWLAMSLVKWLRWGWGEYSRGGLWALALASPEKIPEPAAPPTGGADERPTDAGADLPPEEDQTGGDQPPSD